MEEDMEVALEDTGLATGSPVDAPAEEVGNPEETDEEGANADTEFSRPDFLLRTAVPIVVDHLTVPKDSNHDGDSGALRLAPNFATALLGRWMATKLRLGGAAPEQVAVRASSSDTVIEDVSCLLFPGEGTLVLGPSSSGKTTLMATISNIIKGDICHDKQSVWVGDLNPSSSTTNLSRATAFVDQGDLSLTPILTVEETITFARLCAEGRHDYTEDSIHQILQLVGLDHVANTVVGNADVRGVSGGQKRRVKVLEQAVGKDVMVMFLDEMTNGLDAASALSLAQVLRICLEKTRATAMVSLLQPSTEVFNEFQRLVLLTQDGKVAYSGKRESVLTHFESLGMVKPPTMNVPEFLLRCIYAPHEFQQSSGESTDTIDWSKAFRESPAGHELQTEIDQVQTTCRETKPSQQLPNLKAWAIPVRTQIQLLVQRGWKLVVRNPASILRLIMAVFFGVFIGTLFLHTASDEAGTIIRSGYILTMLFMGFLNASMAPLEDLFKDRNTFYIHRRSNFYKTASYYLSQVITSAPVPLLEAFLLSVISFFLVGMNRNGVGFVYFWIQFSILALNGNAVSRNLAYSLPSEDVAQTVGPAVLLVVILTTGQSPQYLQVPVWLRWISWISPAAYCYEGVIVNEMMKRTVTTTNGEVEGWKWAQDNLGIPRIHYDQAPAGLNTEGSLMAFDCYLLIALTIVFEIMGCVFLHRSQNWYGPATKRYQVAAGMSLATPPSFLTKQASSSTASVTVPDNNENGLDNLQKSQRPSSVPTAPPAHLTAQGIIYEVDVDMPKEEAPKEDVTKERESKKSSGSFQEEDELYDIPMTVEQYGQPGKGKWQETRLKRMLGEDAVNSAKSLTASSNSSAFIRTELPPTEPGRLRLLSGITASFEPGTMTALMGSSGAGKTTLLDVLAGYKTGGHITGDISINGKQKTDATWKSIAAYCEQVDLHNPALTVRESLIFAARMRLRPWSLPDKDKVAFAANILMLLGLEEFADMLVGDESLGEGLPKHARKRLTVGVEMCSNPSILFTDEPTSGLDSLSASVVVSSLERLAKQEGLTVVCTIHQPSRGVFEAFDNLLLLRKGGVCVYNGRIDELDTYMRAAPDGERFAMPDGANPADHTLDIFCGPGGEGVDWSDLYERSDMAAAAMKGHEEDAAKLGAISVDISPQKFTSELFVELQRELLVFWRTPTYMAIRFLWTVVANVIIGVIYRGADRLNIVGSIFFYVNVATVPLLSAMVPLIKSRAIFYREIASGTYRRLVYGVAVHLAEIPFNIGCAIASFVIFYYLVGFSNDGEKKGYFLLLAFATYWMFPAFGQFLAFISPNVGVAVAFGGLLLTVCTLTMGFLIPPNAIPAWWIWLYWINPLRYVMQGFVVNEMGGDGAEGDAFLSSVDWSYDNRWWYCYVAVLMFGVAFTLGTLAATRISWLKR